MGLPAYVAIEHHLGPDFASACHDALMESPSVLGIVAVSQLICDDSRYRYEVRKRSIAQAPNGSVLDRVVLKDVMKEPRNKDEGIEVTWRVKREYWEEGHDSFSIISLVYLPSERLRGENLRRFATPWFLDMAAGRDRLVTPTQTTGPWCMHNLENLVEQVSRLCSISVARMYGINLYTMDDREMAANACWLWFDGKKYHVAAVENVKEYALNSEQSIYYSSAGPRGSLSPLPIEMCFPSFGK